MARKKTRRYHAGFRTIDGRRYTVWRYEPDELALAVDRRTHPRQNSFDQSYIIGRLPMWIRGVGHRHENEEADGHKYEEPRPLGYNRPAAEEPYLQALAEFFDTRIALMPPKPRQVLQDVKDWLHSVMYDTRPLEDIAKEKGFSDRSGPFRARERAVAQLVESCGGKARLAELLREFMVAKEAADGKDRLKYLPRWVHG